MKHVTSPMIPRIIAASANPDRRGCLLASHRPAGRRGRWRVDRPRRRGGRWPRDVPWRRWRGHRRWVRRRGRRRYFHAATVPSSGCRLGITQAMPRPRRSRCGSVPVGHVPSNATTTSTTRSPAPGQLTSRASSFDSITTHEPGPTTPSGGRSVSGPRKAAPMITTAIPIAAITPISFHGILAGGPGAGRGTVAVRTRCDERRSVVSHRDGSSWRSYAGPAGIVTEHPIRLVDLRHLGRRRATPVVRMMHAARSRYAVRIVAASASAETPRTS